MITQIKIVTTVENIEKPSKILRRRFPIMFIEFVRFSIIYCCHSKIVPIKHIITTLNKTIHTIIFAAYLNSNMIATDKPIRQENYYQLPEIQRIICTYQTISSLNTIIHQNMN